MSYAEAITRVGQKVRDEEAWPSDSSKENEQLHLLYNSAIAVLKSIPLERLNLSTSSTISAGATGITGLSHYTFPSDTFFYRKDMGIEFYKFDTILRWPTQAIPKEELFHLADNNNHSHRLLFAIDRNNQSFYALGTDDATVEYFNTPTYPTATSDTFPISEESNDYELAMSIVASHVSGETIRDTNAVEFQNFISMVYADDNMRIRNE